ncbi:MAG: phage portal protein [Clostridiales Family XIII bacterium]|jgi:lambda family phage portal protein|nr:phage portal protein [Clostridiales Family XIII bacterium]
MNKNIRNQYRHHSKIRSAHQAKGYSDAGASMARRALKKFLPNSGAPNEDIDWNNYTLRQRGRMLYMASPVATAAINTNRTKVIGMGLTLKSAVDLDVLGLTPEAAKVWQRKTEAEFRLWASQKKNCDATGVNTFEGLQQLAVKSWLMSGDVFALIKRYAPTPANPYTLRLHLIEADRVSTPVKYGAGAGIPTMTDGKNTATGNKIFDGVEVDANGMIVAYHVRNTYPLQIISEPTVWTRVEAYGEKTGLPNILQVMDSERCDQYRGVTYLAPVIEPLLQLRRYTESELVAALVQSFFTAWIITETDPSQIPINKVGMGDGDDVPDEYADGIAENENEHEMGPATVLHLQDGEDVKFGDPNVPTAGFENFVKTLCCIVGAALELPKDILLKEFGKSYSASRAALLEAWEAFKMRRKWFVDDFCQPTYEVWLAEAVARGRVKAPGFFADPLIRAAWCGAQWIGPVQGQLDPTKEVKAAIYNVQRGFKTHEQVTREMSGGDWEANIEQLAFEYARMREAGIMNEPVSEDSTEDDGNKTEKGDEDSE